MDKRIVKLNNDYFETLNDQKISMYFCDNCGESFFDTDEFNELVKKNICNLNKNKEEISKDKIFGVREKYNLSQKEMSLILGRSISLISKLENGERKLVGTLRDIYTEYFFQGRILDFVEKYKEDIPKEDYDNILRKIRLNKNNVRYKENISLEDGMDFIDDYIGKEDMECVECLTAA
jgi:transcriptional regulator with XRE-family HTH domain